MRAALIGNPNCGKTLIFNNLTGSNQHVGNWAGVTVEKKTGEFYFQEEKFEIIDLPGIYSLDPYSLEEKIAHKYIEEDGYDVVVNVIDSTDIEKSLFLTMQLLELNKPLIIVLNMMDLVEKKGITINIEGLSNELSADIIYHSAKKNIGEEELKQAMKNYLEISKKSIEIQSYLNKISQIDDLEEKSIYRYKYINELLCKYYKKNNQGNKKNIDRYLTNKYLGIPIFLIVMWLIYFLAINVVGKYSTFWIENIIKSFTDIVRNLLVSANANEKIISLITDGIIAGVGSILVFLPQILALFALISVLEDSGYMSRVSFILDRVFKKIGLSGKSFIPMFVGSGCSVPGIMAARTLESEKDRKITIVLTPFISCGAKMPIYILFASAFFPEESHWVIFTMYSFGFLAIVISSLLFNRVFFSDKRQTFIMELPSYKLPSYKNTLKNIKVKAEMFIKKAGTLIFAGAVIVWFLQSFTIDFKTTVDTGDSLLGHIGKIIAPIFKPLGFSDWKISVAFITGFIAKEMVISTLAVLNGIADSADLSLMESIRQSFTPVSAMSFMVFTALASPCIAALATMKKELNSWKMTIFAIFYQTGIAYLMALLSYNLLKLLWR